MGSIAVFDCLRNASSADVRSAMLSSQSLWDYQSVDLAWQPWADGTFLAADAQQLVLNGSGAEKTEIALELFARSVNLILAVIERNRSLLVPSVPLSVLIVCKYNNQ